MATFCGPRNSSDNFDILVRYGAFVRGVRSRAAAPARVGPLMGWTGCFPRRGSL
jgi:hypothetical protein